MDNVILAADQVADRLDAIRTTLNTSSSLRLYTNNITPDPDSDPSTWTLATYTGYANIDLTGVYPTKTNPAAGEYEIDLPDQEFAAPTSGGSQTIYLWAIRDGSGNYVYFGKLPTAWVASVGGQPLRLRIKLRDYSSVRFPCDPA